jgi:hypothetical protein
LKSNDPWESQQEFEELFISTKRFTVKQKQFLEIYRRELREVIQSKGEEITLLEFGIGGGGSLLFWRRLLGERARIVGVDLNPDCAKLSELGFEIFIGNQSDPEFIKSLFSIIGKCDIIIDDGGHTNYQQISTLVNSIEFVQVGGRYFIEDLQTSFSPRWGNPSKYSTVEFLKLLIDQQMKRNSYLNSRFDALTGLESVFKISFVDGLAIIEIDPNLVKY